MLRYMLNTNTCSHIMKPSATHPQWKAVLIGF